MSDRTRIAWMGALAFAILASYECVRPAAESLFLERYGAGALPYVWIAVPVAAAVAVAVYNRFATFVRLMHLMSATSAVAATLFVLLIFAVRREVFGSAFLLYVVKDVYIVILVEIFWSYANANFPIKTARWIYGLFCVMGSLGGATADFVVGRISEQYGSMSAFYCVLPVLLAIMAGAATAPRSDAPIPRRTSSFHESFQVLRKSSYLIWLLLLIATTQVVITLIDFGYNSALETAYPDTDQRTGVISNVYFAINVSAIFLQLATGPILRYAGVPFALFAVPLLLGSGLGAFLILPRFLLLAVSKVMSKCLDYSLFRAAKEILYIPLSYPEKTQGKALVDMLTYRVAKGGSALLLLALAGWKASALVVALTLALIVFWLGLTWVITRRYASTCSSPGTSSGG